MGGLINSQQSNKHLLHYYTANENRLYYFDATRETFHCLPVFYKGKPFFFGQLKSINCPQLNLVLLVGGRRLPDSVPFSYAKKETMQNQYNSLLGTLENKDNRNNLELPSKLNDISATFIEENFKSNFDFYAKVDPSVNMESLYYETNFIGYINLNSQVGQ